MTGRSLPTDVIAEFYDRHPYPPPRPDLDAALAQWRDPERRRSEHFLHFPNKPYREDPEVLIAGCGTFQAALHALRWPDGRVTGIDVSETSLRHTADLKTRYDLENLEIRQLPIERVGELERNFDLVISTGVVHHLADPGVGLRALAGVLKTDGAIHLMVYARYGRHGVHLIQEYARRIGIGVDDVDDLLRTVAEIPADHPLAPLLRQSPDFRDPDAMADALLNPREQAYSVPELMALLEGAGLGFGRWHRQAQYLPQCGFPAQSPHRRRLTELPAAEQYAAIELLRGSIARHTVIAHKTDGRGGRDQSGLADDHWDAAVPIRLPHTVTVRDRLPPGAAAVLINRAHTYTDLILPISEAERLVVARIDGRRTIAETGEIGPANPPDLRRLYERLWWYDQVVFATTKPKT